MLRAIEQYRAHGDEGLRPFIARDLAIQAAELEALVRRNVLAKE
jgi:hypothetical protein